MSEPEDKLSETPEVQSPIVYASPTKRVWAWVGVVYMLIILLLVTYYLARARFIGGVGPLMLIPALGGFAANAVVRYKTGLQARGGPVACGLLVALCGVLIVFFLVAGIPGLLSNFGG